MLEFYQKVVESYRFSVDIASMLVYSTSMNAKTLIHMSGAKVPTIAEYAGVFWTSVYKALRKDPTPLWLLRALDRWYSENAPITPISLDSAFRLEFKNAWDESAGVPAILRTVVTESQIEAKVRDEKETTKRFLRKSIIKAHDKECDAAECSKPVANLSGQDASPRASDGCVPTPAIQPDELTVPIFTEDQIKLPDCSAARWKQLKTNALRSQFIAAINTRGWGQGKTERSIKRRLQSIAGKCHRPDRLPDLALLEAKDRVAEFLLSKVAPVETNGVKGFGLHFENHTWMDQLATIKGILKSEKMRDEIERIYGKELTVSAADKIFRDRHGVASKLDIASDKLRSVMHQTTGIQANWAGEFFYWDATRLPVVIDGCWGKRQKNTQAHWMHCMTDDRSLMTLMYIHALKSETAAWDDAIIDFYTRLGYAPPQVYTDNASRLVADLYQQNYMQDCTLGQGMRLAICSGTHVSSHRKNNPSAKGRIEAGAMKPGKSEIKTELIARACEQSLDLKNYRHIPQGEWWELIPKFEAALNAHSCRGEAFTRQQGFDCHAESKAHRDALVFNLEHFAHWQNYTDAVQLGQVVGKTIRFKRPGEKTQTFELFDPTGLLPVNHCNGSTVIMAPSGLRKDDDPDEMRVVVVDALDKAKISKHYSVRAKCKAKTFWGDLDHNKIGSHPVTKIASGQTQTKRNWFMAANPDAMKREATTGGEVSGPAFGADE